MCTPFAFLTGSPSCSKGLARSDEEPQPMPIYSRIKIVPSGCRETSIRLSITVFVLPPPQAHVELSHTRETQNKVFDQPHSVRG